VVDYANEALIVETYKYQMSSQTENLLIPTCLEETDDHTGYHMIVQEEAYDSGMIFYVYIEGFEMQGEQLI
jgi:hypothetical protein